MFTLPNKDISSYEHHYEKDGVTIGGEVYSYERLAAEVFPPGIALFPRRPMYSRRAKAVLTVVELVIINGTSKPIAIIPRDLVLKYEGKALRAEAVRCEIAQRYIRRGFSFYDWLGIPGSPLVPQTVAIVLPVLMLGGLLNLSGLFKAFGDYRAWQRSRSIFWTNRFEYGRIGPGETRRGFVYIEVDESNIPPRAFQSPGSWGLDVNVHRREAIPAGYLPEMGCIVPVIVCQVGAFAAMGYLAARLLGQSAGAYALMCGGGYGALALVMLYALSKDTIWWHGTRGTGRKQGIDRA